MFNKKTLFATLKDELSCLITKYSHLPRHFFVSFNLYCVNDIRHMISHATSIKALNTVQLWLDGKATEEDVRMAADIIANDYATFQCAHSSDSSIYNAYYAIFWCAANCISTIPSYDYVTGYTSRALIANYFGDKRKGRDYYNKCVNEFNRRLSSLSKIEKILYNVEGIDA